MLSFTILGNQYRNRLSDNRENILVEVKVQNLSNFKPLCVIKSSLIFKR